jgi:tetratricopeptide (TPR) repeat protein
MLEADLSFAEAMNRGATLLEQGRPSEALPFLVQAAGLRPDDMDLAVNLGGAHLMLGNFCQAVSILEAAAHREPGKSQVWINLGAAYLGAPESATPEKRALAIAAFERALELDPAAPSVNYNLGLIYRDQADLEMALVHLRRASAINPLDRDARSLVERVERMCKDRDEAPEAPADGPSDG